MHCTNQDVGPDRFLKLPVSCFYLIIPNTRTTSSGLMVLVVVKTILSEYRPGSFFLFEILRMKWDPFESEFFSRRNSMLLPSAAFASRMSKGLGVGGVILISVAIGEPAGPISRAALGLMSAGASTSPVMVSSMVAWSGSSV